MRNQFAIGTADLVVLAAIVVETDAVAPTYSGVDVRAERLLLHHRRPEPADQIFRLGPRRVDFFRRCVDAPLEGETWSGGDD